MRKMAFYDTGCSLNIVFYFEDLKIFWTLAFLRFPSVSVCVHIPGRKNTSAAAELAEFRKIKKNKENIHHPSITERTEKGKRTNWRKRLFEEILSLQKIPSYAVQYTCPKKKVYLQLDHEFAEVATTLWAKPILQSWPTLIRHALLIYSQINRVQSIVFDVNYFFCIWCIRTDKICYVKSDVKVCVFYAFS